MILEFNILLEAPPDPGRGGVVERKDDLYPESYWVVVGDIVLCRNWNHLYLLQKIPQKEDDFILPLVLDWHCDAPADSVRCDDGVIVNPGVCFDLTPAVVDVPACDDSELPPDASIDHDASNGNFPSNSELLNALDLAVNDLPNNTNLADANGEHASFDNVLLVDCQYDLLDNNKRTNAKRDVQIDPSSSLVLPLAKTGTVPERCSKLISHKSKPDWQTTTIW